MPSSESAQTVSLARGVLAFATVVILLEAFRASWWLVVVAPKLAKIYADMAGPGAALPVATRAMFEYGFQIGAGVLLFCGVSLFWMWSNIVRRSEVALWVAAAVYLVLFAIKSIAASSGLLPALHLISDLSNFKG